MRRHLSFKVVLIAGVCALALTSCFRRETAQRPQAQEAQKSAIPVRVAKVELRDLDEVLEFVGNIRAKEEVAVYPKVSGKIVEKAKEEGAAVKKGEAIASIDRDEVGLTYEKAPVESPLEGVIGRVYVDIGSYVTPQTPVALVVDMEKMKIDLSVPEKYVSKVSVGQEAKIRADAYANEDFTGVITKVSPVLDVDTRSVPIEITVDNVDHRLKSGMYAKVRLTVTENARVPVILKEALVGRGDDQAVFIAKNDKAEWRKVKVGIREGAYVGLTEGADEGELVVIMGQQRLSDGAAIRAEEWS